MSENVRNFMSLWESGKPVIAQVHGHCLAGGTDIALLCDMVIAADDAVFGFPPARDLGALGAWLILVHGVEDDIIPASESRALAAAVDGRADLFLVDGFGHVGAEPGAFGTFALWRPIYRLLELRDAAPAA